MTGITTYIGIINIVTFLAFAIDKLKAERDQWRISEKTLLSLCVIGGSLGGLIGMYSCHHKTRKPQFRYGVPIILAIQILVLKMVIA